MKTDTNDSEYRDFVKIADALADYNRACSILGSTIQTYEDILSKDIASITLEDGVRINDISEKATGMLSSIEDFNIPTIPPASAFEADINKDSVVEVATEGLLSIISGLLRYINNIVSVIKKFFMGVFTSTKSSTNMTARDLDKAISSFISYMTAAVKDNTELKIISDNDTGQYLVVNDKKSGHKTNIFTEKLTKLVRMFTTFTPGKPFEAENFIKNLNYLNINDEEASPFILFFTQAVAEAVETFSNGDNIEEGLFDRLTETIETYASSDEVSSANTVVEIIRLSSVNRDISGSLKAVFEMDNDKKKFKELLVVRHRQDESIAGVLSQDFISEFSDDPVSTIKEALEYFRKAYVKYLENYQRRNDKFKEEFKKTSKKTISTLDKLQKELQSKIKKAKKEGASEMDDLIRNMREVSSVLKATTSVNSFYYTFISSQRAIAVDTYENIARHINKPTPDGDD